MVMARRRRLDAELVEQGFFSTADEAMRAVLAGEVSGKGHRFDSPGEQVKPGTFLYVRGKQSFVSRGGIKLNHAFTSFHIDPHGLYCLDIGCSTGGFTDCLLRRGARHVVAVDVGYAQFSWALRQDERVTLLERTNILSLPGGPYDASFDLAVCDVSFTSIRTILPAITALLVQEGVFIALVKPQFEADREHVEKGGVIHDEAVRQAALAAVVEALKTAGFGVLGSCESPIRGHKGNVEYLVAAHYHG